MIYRMGCFMVNGRFSYLSYPIVSPEPSDLLQPALSDDSSLSHPSRSEADMLTSSLNSLGCNNWVALLLCTPIDQASLDVTYSITVPLSFTILYG